MDENDDHKKEHYVIYNDDGSKKILHDTRDNVLVKFVSSSKAIFFVLAENDPGWIWNSTTLSWTVNKNK